MDAIVDAALKKWPNVPHCYGWLALDGRGDWYMRDERIQAAGPFPRVKGSRIEHEKLRGFIERNYTSDERGAWFFQNGPQRVYVELEAAPWVWRLDAPMAASAGTSTSDRQVATATAPAVTSHTGRAATPGDAFVDENGRLFLATDLGFGLVHSLDVGLAAEAIDGGLWTPRERSFGSLVEGFGYRLTPAAP